MGRNNFNFEDQAETVEWEWDKRAWEKKDPPQRRRYQSRTVSSRIDLERVVSPFDCETESCMRDAEYRVVATTEGWGSWPLTPRLCSPCFLERMERWECES